MANKNKQNKSGTPTPTSSAPDTEIDSTERRRILSAIILERLQKQDVVWVRITDPDVLRVGDLQIATKARVDAYLIRWSEWADTLTLDDLTSTDTDSDCLIKQLANGWKDLKKQYRLPVTVHLLTNDQPSAKKIKGTRKSDCHLAKFLAIEWKKNNRDNEDWSMIWDQLRTASGLSESRFSEFVEACKFDCSYAIPELDEEAAEYQPFYWVEHIYDTLFEHEDHATLPIELNHAELLQLLGWRREQSRQILKLPKGQGVSNPDAALQSDFDASEGAIGGDNFAGNTVQEAQKLNDFVSSSNASNRLEGDAIENYSETVNEENHSRFQQSQSGSKPQPSLSSLRGASAAWLQAASDADSETADWLKSGTQNAGTTASGGTYFGNSEITIPPDSGGTYFGRSEITIPPDSGVLSSPGGADVSDNPTNRSSLSTSLTGKKQAKEKPSWKDLAEKNREAPGPRKFGEPVESRSDSADSQRISGRLRQMMSSIKTETREETDEEDDTSDGCIDRGDSHTDFNEQEKSENSEQGELSEPDLGTKRNQDEDADDRDDDLAEGIDNADEHSEADLGNTFSRISRLARKQEGTDAGDMEANLDAFRWYISNGDELFHETRFEDAEKEYVRALALIGSLDVPTSDEEFKVLQNLGDIYLFLDQPEKAVELYECTIAERFTSKVPPSKYIAALVKLGAEHEEKNCFNDAERQYRKAVEVAAEHLEKDDPILVRLNQACLDLARNRSTLMSRFSATEVERIRVLAAQESEVAIMHRKKKTTEADLAQPELWKGGSRPQDEQIAYVPPSSKQRWMLASAAFVIVFIFAFASFVPHGVVPDATVGATDESMGTYTSVDGLKAIELGPSGRAHYSFNGHSKDARYSFVGNTIQDLLPFIPGHLRTAFMFFNSKDDAIVDASGVSFYAERSPEHMLVKQMWKYASLAQGYRHEKNFYPETDEAWTISKEKLTFLNPITRAQDQATIFSEMGEATDTPIRKQIADGELWKGQPVPTPGRITCNVYNSRMFFIRGYDRNGKVLTSSDPKRCFYIECSDGLDITKEDLAKPPEEKKDSKDAEINPIENPDKKLRFIFAASPETEGNFNLLLSAVPGALFALTVVTLAIWRYRVNKKKAGPFSLAIFGLSAILLLAWFVIGILQV